MMEKDLNKRALISRMKCICQRHELLRPFLLLMIAVVMTEHDVINTFLCSSVQREQDAFHKNETVQREEALRRQLSKEMIVKAVQMPIYVRSAPYEFDVRMLVGRGQLLSIQCYYFPGSYNGLCTERARFTKQWSLFLFAIRGRKS